MSSNLRLTRICQCCGREFEARTTVTKTCSDPCAKRLYKQRQRQQKVAASEQETQAIRLRPLEAIKAKEFLTVGELSALLNSSKKTVYNLIAQGIIPAVNLSQRKTLIKRSAIDKLFNPL